MAFQSKPSLSDSLMGRKCLFYGQLQSPDVASVLKGSAQSIQKLNRRSLVLCFSLKSNSEWTAETLSIPTGTMAAKRT